LTPIQFQAYSGSTRSDWKSAIILYSKSTLENVSVSRKRKKKDELSIKKLVQNNSNNIKIHSFECDCQKCFNSNSYIQSENINVFNCFFMNNGHDLITLYPNNKNNCQINVNLHRIHDKFKSISELLVKCNYENLRNDTENKINHTINLKNDNDFIKQIQTKTFDENSYYFDNSLIAQEVNKAYITINLNNNKVKTFLLELNNESNENYLNTKLLYEAKTNNDYIISISSSHLIPGESAVLFDNNGEIHLLSEENDSNCFDDKSCIVKGLESCFSLKNGWKNVQFGAQPRQFIYSDYSQVISIDSRIKSKSNQSNIFNLSNNYIESGEIISRSQIAENDYFFHLICCNKTLLLIDERYTKQPLLSWKHNLKSPAVFLESLFIPKKDYNQTNKEYTHFAIISDTYQNIAYQFSTKNGMCLSHNFPMKLDSPLDMIECLPESYDKRLTNHLKYRTNEQVIGFNGLKYFNSFALFQVILFNLFKFFSNCNQCLYSDSLELSHLNVPKFLLKIH